MYNPNVKLVDLYKDGVWKCKIEYKKVLSSQQENNHQNSSWQLVGAKFDYENNPGSEVVQELQFAQLPTTVTNEMTRIDI